MSLETLQRIAAACPPSKWKRNNTELIASCPLCAKQKLTAGIGRKGIVVVNCWVCGADAVYTELLRMGLISKETQSAKSAGFEKSLSQKKKDDHQERVFLAMTRHWNESQVLNGFDAASQYLWNRGLIELFDEISGNASFAQAVRFHPSAYHWVSGQTFPALVASHRDLSGNIVSLRQIYLSRGGSKAPVTKAKLMWAGASNSIGSAHQLYPVDESGTLAVCEGIETALAVRVCTGLPTWAAGSAAHMQSLSIPCSVRNVRIFADLDPHGRGEVAARKLAERACSLPNMQSVKLIVPPAPLGSECKQDFLDYFLELRNREKNVNEGLETAV